MPRAAAALALALAAGAALARGEGQGFLFDTQGERPLTVPYKLNVGLLGFDDTLPSGALDPLELESALAAALPFRAPRAIDTGAGLGVEFSLEYNIVQLPAADLAAYEAALRASATPAHARVRSDDAPLPMDVEVTAAGGAEEVLDRVFHREFAADGTYSADMSPSPVSAVLPSSFGREKPSSRAPKRFVG